MKIPRTILVLRFSSIGDIVQATSPLITLHKIFPESKIDFITLSDFAPILEHHPLIRRIIQINKKLPVKMLKEIGRRLDSDYDFFVDLHNSIRSNILLRRIDSSKILVYKKPRWKRFMLFQFHKNYFHDGINQRRLYHKCLTKLNNNIDEIPDTKLDITENENKYIKQWLKSKDVHERYIVVIPSAAWQQKVWQQEKYKSVLNSILSNTEKSIIILGAAKDTICDEILLPNSRVLNLKGKTDLRMSLAIINNADAVLGSDTGLMHAGEALGVPAVMIMGPTSYETGGGTQLGKSTTITGEDLWCRPCSQNGKKPCYRSEKFCMTGINPEKVTTALLNTLAVT